MRRSGAISTRVFPQWRTGHLTGFLVLLPNGAYAGFTSRPDLGQRDRRACAGRDHLTGRVINLDGEPVRGEPVTIWQANTFGRYVHNDPNPTRLDPHFVGCVGIRSDEDGVYRIKTAKPGAYPAGPDWMRPPHIHFEVHGRFERLITQMYFPHEPLNTSDSCSTPHYVQTCWSRPASLTRRVVAFCISTLSYHGDGRFPSTRPTPAGSRSCESPLRAIAFRDFGAELC